MSVGLFLTIVLHVLSRTYELVLHKHSAVYNAVEQGVYAAISRTFYVLPYAFILFVCFGSGFGKKNIKILHLGYQESGLKIRHPDTIVSRGNVWWAKKSVSQGSV